jgi:hypothetical protein
MYLSNDVKVIGFSLFDRGPVSIENGTLAFLNASWWIFPEQDIPQEAGDKISFPESMLPLRWRVLSCPKRIRFPPCGASTSETRK